MLPVVTPRPAPDAVGTKEASGLSETLRFSYLLTLPFFNVVAFLTNILIFFVFSTDKMKRFRASVYFRFVALVDAACSVALFGVMWLAIVLPPSLTPSHHLLHGHLHCRAYTVFRYTLQDLSAYGLLCLTMERCLSVTTRGRRPLCAVVTICRHQCVLPHFLSKLSLFGMSVLVLVVNMGMVLGARSDLHVTHFRDCFNTWKSPHDFTARSLAMSHALLGMLFPALFCMLSSAYLRSLTCRRPVGRWMRPDHQIPTRRQPQHLSIAARIGRILRWLRPGTATTTTTTTTTTAITMTTPTTPANAHTNNVFFTRPGDVMPTADVTVMPMDYGPSAVRGGFFLDRLYATIKSREFLLSVVRVEDSRIVALPPRDTADELDSMAIVSAVFFVVFTLPHMALLVMGCLLGSSMNWPLMKTLSQASDLLSNNRLNFTLFLYLCVSGRRFSSAVLGFLEMLLAFCLPCVATRRPPTAPATTATPLQPLRPPPYDYVQREVRQEGHAGDVGPRYLTCAPQVHGGGGGGSGGGDSGGGGRRRGGDGGEGEGETVVPKLSIMTPC